VNITVVFYHILLHCKYIGVCSPMMAGGRRNTWEDQEIISLCTLYRQMLV